jgi:hypothetical protein
MVYSYAFPEPVVELTSQIMHCRFTCPTELEQQVMDITDKMFPQFLGEPFFLY